MHERPCKNCEYCTKFGDSKSVLSGTEIGIIYVNSDLIEEITDGKVCYSFCLELRFFCLALPINT